MSGLTRGLLSPAAEVLTLRTTDQSGILQDLSYQSSIHPPRLVKERNMHNWVLNGWGQFNPLLGEMGHFL